MRKILTFLFAALMSVGMWALTPLSGDTWDEGTKTLTVNSDLPKDAYKSQDEIQHVIINNGVTSIGAEAFRGCSGLTIVTIPNSVTSIGNDAFRACYGLTSVTCVRETPASLGNNVFYNTHANLKIYVPAGSVADYKAAWTAYADKIKAIPPAWVRAGDDWDEATKTLTVNSNPSYHDYMGKNVIQHVIINNGVTSIGWMAFFYCKGLTSVTIHNSVTSIGEAAFSGCYALTSVTIPSSVEYIGECAFFKCNCLTSVTCERETPANLGHNGVFRDTHANFKIYVPAGSVNAYKGAQYWSYYAAKIKAISPAPEWVRDGDLWDTDTKTLTVKSNLPEDAYKDQTVIKHVIINNDVKSIGNYAFNSCTNLSSVTFGNSVTSIEWGAFAYCTGLTSITIPNSVTSIGEGAFSGCTALTSMVVAGGNTKYDSRENCNAIIEKSSNTLIAGCKNTIIPNSVTSIGDYTFFYCTALTSITIPNSVTSIGDYTFAVCTGLTSITIPNSVTSIGAGAFAACTGLTSIEIPNSVEYIGAEAFAVCTGLPSITIPNSVTSIGDYTFAVCTGLTSVTIGNSVTSIGDSAFMMCSNLESVTCVRETPANLGNDAFNECSKLNAIYVPCGTLDAYQSSWTQYQSNIQYAQPVYTIIGNVNIAEAGTVILPQTICDSSITASPNYGYHFVQWSDGNTENPRTIELTQDTTFTAEFAKNEYTITTESANSEWGTAEGGTSALYLDNIQISALPNYGYHFVRWDDNNTSNPRIIQVTENKTYTATFAKNTYSITKNAVNGSIAGLSQAEYLDEVTLTATPNYGYHFVRWSDGVTENPRAFVLTQDTTFTAEFALDRTGKCGNDWALTWTYDPESKVLKISGNGAFEQNMQCGVEARGKMTEVIFEDGVTSIGNFAFQDCTGLTSVTIGNSVTSIGGSAFHSCSGLKSVSIGNSVTSIGHAAFSACEGLTSIEIPNSVISIGEQAFAMCYSLTSVTIGNSVTSIGEGAFAMCSILESVTILAESLESYGSGAFDDTHANLKIYVPAGSADTYKAGWTAYADKIVAIPPAWLRDGDEWDEGTKTLTVNSDLPNAAYMGKNVIQHVIISDAVTSIGYGAFDGCTGLTSVTIGNSVTSIGQMAFFGCSHLTSVTIGNSVTSIGDNAFQNCSGLTSITIPNSVTRIGVGAFYGCTGLSSIEIPSSVTRIGGFAFDGCTNLEKVTIHAESLEHYGSGAFDGTAAALKIYVPAGSVGTYKAGWSAYEDKIVAIPAPIPTAVENVQTNEVQATKFLRDGMLLIVRDGKTYNAQGAQVR